MIVKIPTERPFDRTCARRPPRSGARSAYRARDVVGQCVI